MRPWERAALIGGAGLFGFLVFGGAASAGTGGAPGPGGSPPLGRGGRRWGRPPSGATYDVPPDWDELRGLWISPDCEMVVEGPGFWCGLQRRSLADPTLEVASPGVCDASVERPTLAELWAASPTVGAVGHADFWLSNGAQPGEVAMAIVRELAPLCSEGDPSQWSDAVAQWFNHHVERVTDYLAGELELGGE